MRQPHFEGAFMELNQDVFEPIHHAGRNPLRPRPGLILSGAGQCVESAFSMTLALGNEHKPVLIALYESLNEDGYLPNASVMEAPNLFPGAILQIGLQLPLFNPEGLWAIGNGEYDAQIRCMASRYASLPCPVLLRIGYEFDGEKWNGYEPKAYTAAYRRIAMGLMCALNVALVWDSYTTDTNNVMDWYPGDDVVDWFGYNTMSPKFDCGRMQKLAREHGKPLLNGEASYAMDADHLPFSQWAKEYFESMRAHHVQAYQYINWRWQVYPRCANWYDWQDGRITEDPEKMAAYKTAMIGPDLVVRGISYAQPLRLVIDCGRAIVEGTPSAPWKPEDDHITFKKGYGVWVEGAWTTYGNGWQCGWVGERMTLHVCTPEDFSGALLLKPLAGDTARLRINGREVFWRSEDGFVRIHHLTPGNTVVSLCGIGEETVALDLIALMAYAPEPPSVTGLTINDGTLSWIEVEGAECYSVYNDGVLVGRTEINRFLLPFTAACVSVSVFDSHLGEGKPAHVWMEDNHE
jgi:hypothetical protein